MRTASIFFPTYHINDQKRLSSTQKSYAIKKHDREQIKYKNQSKKYCKDYVKAYLNKQEDNDIHSRNMKKCTQSFSKPKSFSNTRRNSINFSQEKNHQKQDFKTQMKKNQHNQITKNLEFEAKNYLNFLKQLLKQTSSVNKHEKIRINQWMMKLQQPMHNDIWRQNRNFYLKVLIEMINFGVISEPFSNVPADGQLSKLTIYDIAFPIRERLLEQRNEITNQKTRQKSRKSSQKVSISKNNKQNNPNIGNILQEGNFKNNINRNLYKEYQDNQISQKKIKAGTMFQFSSKKKITNSKQNYNKINFLGNSKKNEKHMNSISSVQMIKRKIFNQIENLSSINKNEVSNSALINDSDESEYDHFFNKNIKRNSKNNSKKKVFHTMKTEEFMKTSVQEEEKPEYQNEYEIKKHLFEKKNIQKGLNIISELQLILWQKQKNFKANGEYHSLMNKISKLLNMTNKQTFQQNRKDISRQKSSLITNNQNNPSFSNISQSLDISKLFNQQSESNSFKVLSQKMKSKFNKTGKDTKQFLDFLRSYK